MIQDELERMNRFVDDLLLLPRRRGPDFLRLGPLDLDLFTHDLFAKARSLGDRDWRLDGTGVGLVVADPHRLTQAVMNLADNAVRHTRAGEPIWLGSSLIERSGPPLGARRGARDRPGRPRANLRALRARRARASQPRRRRRARALDRARDRRGARRLGRARLEPGPGLDLHHRHSPRRRTSEPDPDRRGRGTARLLPREGPAVERLRDHRRRRTAGAPGRSPTTRTSTCSSSTSACPARTDSTCCATCARRASSCR